MQSHTNSHTNSSIPDLDIKKDVTKKKWLWVLNSVYVAPYFDLEHSKGKSFLSDLVKNLNVSSTPSKDLTVPPWSLNDFQEVFIGFTDGLHRFNHPAMIKAIFEYQKNYIFQNSKKQIKDRDKNFLKAASMLEIDNLDSKVNPTLEGGNENQAKSEIKENIELCFESLFFNKQNQTSKILQIFPPAINSYELEKKEIEDQRLSGEDGKLNTMAVIDADKLNEILRHYEKKALTWRDAFNEKFKDQNKEEMKIKIFSWMEIKNQNSEHLETAREFFKSWWENPKTQLKKTIIDYCSRFPIGRYDDNLKKISDKTFPFAFTGLSSALFVAEELVCFLAKLLHDGPGIIVYPTANLGAKNKEEITPFTLLQKLIQEDSEFVKKMSDQHHIKTEFLEYTYPGKKGIAPSPVKQDTLESIQDLREVIRALQQENDKKTRHIQDLEEENKKKSAHIKNLEVGIKCLEEEVLQLKNKDEKNNLGLVVSQELASKFSIFAEIPKTEAKQDTPKAVI